MQISQKVLNRYTEKVELRKTIVLIRPCTFQEYKLENDIISNEYDDLDRGYTVLSDFGCIFVPDIMVDDLFKFD